MGRVVHRASYRKCRRGRRSRNDWQRKLWGGGWRHPSWDRRIIGSIWSNIRNGSCTVLSWFAIHGCRGGGRCCWGTLFWGTSGGWLPLLRLYRDPHSPPEILIDCLIIFPHGWRSRDWGSSPDRKIVHGYRQWQARGLIRGGGWVQRLDGRAGTDDVCEAIDDFLEEGDF